MDHNRNPREKFFKYTELNENENTTAQNLWNTANEMLRGKSVTLNVYITKEKILKSNHLSSHLKNLEKEPNRPKASMRKEIIKCRDQSNRK